MECLEFCLATSSALMTQVIMMRYVTQDIISSIIVLYLWGNPTRRILKSCIPYYSNMLVLKDIDQTSFQITITLKLKAFTLGLKGSFSDRVT